jgi:hypothetical protein
LNILAISDQHGFLPDIPPCDLLIVAGDNCPDYPTGARDRVGTGPQTARQRKWFETEWMAWRKKQPANMCVVTFGNHDYCGESIHAACAVVWHDANTVSVVDAPIDDGDCAENNGRKFDVGGLVLWLTPWSSQFRDWAFMAEDWRLLDHYKDIPEGIDILVSHQPPAGYGDALIYDLEVSAERYLGSRALKETIMRVKPKAVVCGHIHSGFGQFEIPHFGVEAVTTGEIAITKVYNVALVNERYELVNPPTRIVL